MTLTTSQRAAVAFDGNLIIFAGPGSGKTKTSVEKGLKILRKPGTVLGMITFTTAAAQEMRERMAKAAGAESASLLKNRLVVGTFNSLTLRHYQQHARPALKLLAPPQRAAMVHSMLREKEAAQREEFITALDAHLARLNPNLDDLDPSHAAFIRKYEEKLRATHAIDLAGVMRECTIRIASGEMPRMSLSHLLGDEMQDADEVQIEFMLAHVRKGVVGTLVADDDQTIYEWRSAMGYAGLTQFAEKTGAKTIVLAENFRSRDEIVSHATMLIAHNDPNRIPKNQQPVRGSGGVLAHVRCADLAVETNRVARSIQRFRAEGESVAVLARTNMSLWAMQSALIRRGIPFRRDGPSMWDTQEVAVYMSLLKALVTSQTPDLAPLLTAGPFDNPLVLELVRQAGPECASFLDGEVPDLQRATAIDRENLQCLSDATSKWRKELRKGGFDVVILEAAELAGSFLVDGMPDDQRRKGTQRVYRLLEDASNVLADLRGKLSRRLQTIQSLQASEADPRAVRLLTMHSSKGLEFDTVYLIDAVRPDDGSARSEEEAERRLFYVALTRARERFIATYSDKPSQFIFEAELPRLLTLAEVWGSAEGDDDEEEESESAGVQVE